MQIEIKHYDGTCNEQIIENILTIQRDEFGIPITREDQPDICDISSFYMKGKGTFIIAACGENVIGTLGLIDIGNEQLALRKMFVNKNFRGKPYNVAQNLLDQAIKWAREQDIQQLFLGTTALFLSAHRFYEKNGFYRVEKEKLPEAFPVMKVDTIFYRFNI